jgi:hypothetical protein
MLCWFDIVLLIYDRPKQIPYCTLWKVQYTIRDWLVKRDLSSDTEAFVYLTMIRVHFDRNISVCDIVLIDEVWIYLLNGWWLCCKPRNDGIGSVVLVICLSRFVPDSYWARRDVMTLVIQSKWWKINGYWESKRFRRNFSICSLAMEQKRLVINV